MNIGAVLAGGAAAIGAAAVGYRYCLRRSIMTWGATVDEVDTTFPGDDLLPDADGVSTRAITIEAQPDHVYPWLAQMGPYPRGGAYTYDWVENLLGLNMHSADVILDEFSHPGVGEQIGLGTNLMTVEIADPGQSFVLRSGDGNWVWAFTLLDRGDGTTRLISRNRYRLPRLMDRIGMLPLEPGSLIMERRMLFGIKQRAEALEREHRV